MLQIWPQLTHPDAAERWFGHQATWDPSTGTTFLCTLAQVNTLSGLKCGLGHLYFPCLFFFFFNSASHGVKKKLPIEPLWNYENWTTGCLFQEVEFAKATQMHLANIYSRGYFGCLEKRPLCTGSNRTDRSGPRQISVLLSLASCHWKLMKNLILWFLSYLGR